MSAATVRFEGRVIKLGGQDYVVPPLSLRHMQQFQPIIGELTSGKMDEVAAMKFNLDIILAAFQRNYSEMTMDQVLDLIDVGNIITVRNAVLNTSGFVRTSPGKAEAESPQT